MSEAPALAGVDRLADRPFALAGAARPLAARYGIRGHYIPMPVEPQDFAESITMPCPSSASAA
jgi:hypothetical protein